MALVLLVASAVLFVVSRRQRPAAGVACLVIVALVSTPAEAAVAAEPFKTLDQYEPTDGIATV